MELSQQVCNLQQAKRLKELGVKQESIFVWQDGEISDNPYTSAKCGDWESCSVCNEHLGKGTEAECKCSEWKADGYYEPWKWQRFKNNDHDYYSAFTVAELGVMLPLAECSSGSVTHENQKMPGDFACEIERQITPNVFYGKTEAEARAAMLIHLLENKILTAEGST